MRQRDREMVAALSLREEALSAEERRLQQEAKWARSYSTRSHTDQCEVTIQTVSLLPGQSWWPTMRSYLLRQRGGGCEQSGKEGDFNSVERDSSSFSERERS